MPIIKATKADVEDMKRQVTEQARSQNAIRPSVEILKGYLEAVLQKLGETEGVLNIDRTILPGDQTGYLWSWLKEIAGFDYPNLKFNRTNGIDGRQFCDFEEYQKWLITEAPGSEECRISFEYKGIKFLWRESSGLGLLRQIIDTNRPVHHTSFCLSDYPIRWEEENKVVIE